ncbi:MAG: copper chaperone PCu(A)C [Alphaproteobacteria bacterium]|nr:copper chaperone PCu(A)C [Alphaproteobacteria bacterium]
MTKWRNASRKCRASGQARTALIALAFILTASLPATAAAPSGVTAEKPWIRFIIPGRPAAGYMTLKNDGDADAVVTGARSPGCGNIMLHKSVTENGMAGMEMVDSVTVPAHGSFGFKPGGYHLMCMETTDKLEIGKTVPLTLEFKDGAELTVEAAVEAGNVK